MQLEQNIRAIVRDEIRAFFLDRLEEPKPMPETDVKKLMTRLSDRFIQPELKVDPVTAILSKLDEAMALANTGIINELSRQLFNGDKLKLRSHIHSIKRAKKPKDALMYKRLDSLLDKFINKHKGAL